MEKGFSLIFLFQKKTMKAKILIIVLYLASLAKLSYAFDDGDFQIWHTEAQEIRLNKYFKSTAEEEFRWGNNAKELYYQHYEFGVVYNANKYLDVGVKYRQIYEKKGDTFKAENQPNVNLTVKTDLFKFKLDDRNRFEYRNFNYQDDYCTYRNKFTAKYPIPISKIELGPYVSDEIFVDFKDKGGFTRNRLYAGLGVNIIKNINADIYYLLQTSKSSGKWKDANVLGTTMKLSF